MADDKLSYKVVMETAKATGELKKLSGSLKNIDGQLKKTSSASEKFNKRMKSMGHLAAGFFAVNQAVSGLTSAIKTVANFEEQIVKLGVVSKASAEDLAKMEEEAKRLGESTQYSASEVAEAMNFLAMAGFDANEVLKSTESVLNLATVGMVDLGRASDIASDTLSAFGLEADEMGRVTDVMTATITSSNTTVEMLGDSFAKVAPVATAMGLSIEETAAALGVMADSGIKGALAGTQLKIALNRIATDKNAAKVFDNLGVSAYDTEGKFKGLIGVLEQLKPKLASLSQEQRNIAIKEIFGSEAIASANVLLGNLDQLKNKLETIRDSEGEAARAAKEMMDTLNGQWKSLQSAFEGLILKVGDELLEVLKNTTKELTEFTRSLDDEKVKKFGKSLSNMVEGAKSAAGAIGDLNDVLAPDAIFGEDASVLEVLGANLGSVADVLDVVAHATDNYNVASKKSKEIMNDASLVYKKSREELEGLKKSIEDQVAENSKLIAKYKEYTGTSDIVEGLTKANDGLAKKADLVNIALANTPMKKVAEETKEASAATKELTDEHQKYIDQLKESGEKRLGSATATLAELKTKETKLYGELTELENKLHNTRLKFANKRLLLNENHEERYRKARQSTMDNIHKYYDDQALAAKRLQQIKEEIEKGNFELAKKHLAEYNSLVDKYAGDEIKVGDRVARSRNQTLADYSVNLKRVKDYEFQMIKVEEAAELKAHNAKISFKQIELQAMKTQIQAQLEIINLLNQIAGKGNLEFTADTSAVQNAISAIDEQIKQLEAHKKKVTVDAELNKEKLNTDLNMLQTQPATVPVEADTKEAKGEIKLFAREMTKDEITLRFGADGLKEKAEKERIEAEKSLRSKEIVIEMDADASGVEDERKAQENKITIVKTPFDPNTLEVEKAAQALRNSRVEVPVWFKAMNSPSTAYAMGGLVQQLAEGGFARRRGKIPGHDTSGSDDVPAMLTRGEFVQNVSAVDHYGADFLAALNARVVPKESLPGFATGGLIDNVASNSLLTHIGALADVSNTSVDQWKGLIDSINSRISSSEGGTTNILNEFMAKVRGARDTSNANINEAVSSLYALDGESAGKVLREEEGNRYFTLRKEWSDAIRTLNENAERRIEYFETELANIKDSSMKTTENRTGKVSSSSGRSVWDIVKDIKKPRRSIGMSSNFMGTMFNQGGLVDLPAKFAANIKIPPIPRFAEGGEVGSTSPSREVKISFAGANGESMDTFSDDAVANALETYFRKFS